jgi:uncharacterized protein (DUF1330 family)
MAAYLIGQINVKDAELWRQYVSGVQESLGPFAAKIIFRGELIAVLAGSQDKDLVVVLEFSDQSILNDWFHSESYQALIPLRDKAADVVISTYKT